jgi:16S rRNA (cytosine967-C5)-methyltransferase
MKNDLHPTLSPARIAAFSTLMEFETPECAPLDERIHTTLETNTLKPDDARLYYQIVQGTTRHRLLLDAIIHRFARAGVEKTPPAVRVALRIAVFQYLFLDRVPCHALVNDSVELVRCGGLPAASCRFANAILRRVTAEPRSDWLRSPTAGDRAGILRRYSLPEWIAREIERAYGTEHLAAEAEALAQPAGMDLRIRRGRISHGDFLKRLADELGGSSRDGLEGEPGRYNPEAVHLPYSFAVARLASYREGLFTVQDEAAQLVAWWMPCDGARRVADFCSAPGGKTTHLAERLGDEVEIWALDINPERLKMVEQAAKRLGCPSVRTALNTSELRTRWKSPGHALDAALVDAPCTSLGTLRRHPDIKWRKTAADPARMAKTQLALLDEAAVCVRPGGILVYSVCTFAHVETLETIERFLSRHRGGWERDNTFEPPAFIPRAWRLPGGDWLTQTGRDGIDGFFVSRLRRLR